MSDVDKLFKLIVKIVGDLKAQEVYDKFTALSEDNQLRVVTLAVSLCITRPDLVETSLQLREQVGIPEC